MHTQYAIASVIRVASHSVFGERDWNVLELFCMQISIIVQLCLHWWRIRCIVTNTEVSTRVSFLKTSAIKLKLTLHAESSLRTQLITSFIILTQRREIMPIENEIMPKCYPRQMDM